MQQFNSLTNANILGMYGKSSKYSRTNRGRSTRSGRRSGTGSFKRAYVPKRQTYSGHTGYNRTMSRGLKRETKFMDDYLNLALWKKHTKGGAGNSTGFTNWVLGGVVTKEQIKVAVQESGAGRVADIRAPRDVAVPNCLTNIETGTSANTRIGNLIEPRYITVKGVVTAAVTTFMDDPETTSKTEDGGSGVAVAVQRYCRTSMRVMIIRDKSMNEQGFVDFSDIFGPPSAGVGTDTNAYLWNRKIDTIGRYEILKQVEFNLDHDDPQKTFNWTIGLNSRQIRYNGASTSRYIQLSEGNTQAGWTNNGDEMKTVLGGGGYVNFGAMSSDRQSMTNGIYVIAVATNITNAATEQMASPTMSMSTRVGFYDN